MNADIFGIIGLKMKGGAAMSEQTKKPFLAIRFEGPQVSAGRMRLSDFIEVANEMITAVERVGLVLSNAGMSTKRGARPKDLKAAVSLDIVGFTHGSPAAVAMLERSETQMLMEGVDLGKQAYTYWLNGFGELTGESTALPAGYDIGVLLKNRDIGRIFGKGVTKVDFVLNHRPKAMRFEYTEQIVEVIKQRIARPEAMEETIEGRLVMVDFKETGPKFRIDQAFGISVYCEFDESFRDEVHDNILKHVRVMGTGRRDEQGRLTSVKLADIEPIDVSEENEEAFSRTAISGVEFWEHHTVEELAKAQGVVPISDARMLLGGWPGDVDDGFEEWVVQSRESEIMGGNE